MIRITEGFPQWAWPLAWEWASARRRQLADDFFPSSIDEFVESYSVRFRDARTYGVWKNDNLGGVIICERSSPVVFTAHILLSRRLWGVQASELQTAATLLFASEPQAIRIQAFVPAWNRLAIALACRIGGTIEGTLRSATLRNGQPADAVLVALIREDLNGTELRGVGRRDGQQLEQQRHDVEHVLAGTDVAAEPDRIGPVVGSGGVKRGHDVPRGRSAGNGVGRHDQQDVGRNGKPDQPVPRGARVRKIGRNGIDSAPNGTRKAKRPRGKSG